MKGKLQNEIKQILRDYDYTRNDDRRLYIEYIKCFRSDLIYGSCYISLDSILDLPSYDTISRIRRQIQHKKEYLPTSEEVKVKRERRQTQVKEDLGYPVNYGSTMAELARLEKSYQQKLM